MKIKNVSSLLLAASLLFVTAHAQQVVSYYAEIPNVSTDSAQALELPGFDTSLGNLTGVKLSYSGEIWQSVFGENMSAASAAYDFSTSAQLGLSKEGGPALFAPTAFTLKRKGLAGAYDGAVNFAGASGVNFNQKIVTSGIYFDPSLSDYTGSHPVSFGVWVSSNSQFQPDGNFAKGASLATLVGMNVDYTFTPLTAIPEPSTYAALMGGVVLLGTALRRRLRLAA